MIINLLPACTASPEDRLSKKEQILGTWYLSEWDNLYHKLYFQDSTHLAIDTRLDTMFFYQYELKNDTLFLFGKKGERITFNLIRKLSPDSLIFESLLDKADIQRYSREGKE